MIDSEIHSISGIMNKKWDIVSRNLKVFLSIEYSLVMSGPSIRLL